MRLWVVYMTRLLTGTIAKCLFHPNPGRFFCLLRQIQRSSAISRIASERVQTDDDAGSEFCYDGGFVPGEPLRLALSAVANVGVSCGRYSTLRRTFLYS